MCSISVVPVRPPWAWQAGTRVDAATAACVLIALYRLAYHAVYLAADPFALGTFSDGALYEAGARDILADPPLGTEPFYLQGLYAYLLALGLALGGAITAGLALQLIVSLLSLVAAVRALRHFFGVRAGTWSALALLSYFPLSFFANKYLSTALGVATNMLVWWAFARCIASHAADARSDGQAAPVPSRAGPLVLGLASALSVLARPDLVLALPFTGAALWRVLPRAGRRRGVGMLLLGLALGLAPMALRNAVVTGAPTVFPAHGGGIPFYIGNNPSADGRWNDAGGLLSGQVGREQTELTQRLALPRKGEAEDAAAIGRALYARALAFIRDDPGAWLRLEGKKLWLTLGNDELARDYDPLGERELLTGAFALGLPFSLLLALGTLGMRATYAERTPRARALCLLLGGQLLAVLAANLAYFTSSQHRLPLAVVLAALSGPGLHAVIRRVRAVPHGATRALPGLLVAGVLLLQGFAPRESRKRPATVHYYNLAVVQERAGDLLGAVDAYGRAIERRPGEMLFHLEQAAVLRRLGKFELARMRLETVRAHAGQSPRWLNLRALREQRLIEQRSTAPSATAAN